MWHINLKKDFFLKRQHKEVFLLWTEKEAKMNLKGSASMQHVQEFYFMLATLDENR